MKTVGEMLKTVREKQGISIAQVSEQTHIKEEFIRALEQGKFSQLPSPLSTQGFISTYATLLHLEPGTALALLRRDYDLSHATVIPKSLTQETRQIKSRRMQQRRFIFSLAGVSIFVVSCYVLWSMSQIRRAPVLIITSPKTEAQVESPVVVKGRTASDAVVEIDTEPVALTQDGEFTKPLPLSVGEHTITIVSRNRNNKETIKQVFVQVLD